VRRSGAEFRPDDLAAGLTIAVPGFLDRYGAALAPDEVDFYERFARGAGSWFAARAAAHTLVHSDFRPDNLLFSVDGPVEGSDPPVAAVDAAIGCSS
jgi:aminoglycoside phosphotransferase (APT) family kinase protein